MCIPADRDYPMHCEVIFIFFLCVLDVIPSHMREYDNCQIQYIKLLPVF